MKLRRFQKTRYQLLIISLIIILIISITLAVMIGPVPIPPLRVWQIALAQLFPNLTGDWTPAQVQIVWLIRFPRVLLAFFVGAGLSVVGVTMQALVRNSLADPYILGVSSGASVGAVLVILFGVFASLGIYAVSVGAFLGAMLSFVVVFLLAQRQGRISSTRLILAGVAISYLFSAVTSFLTLKAGSGDAARRVLFWLLGGLSGTKWADLILPMGSLGIGMVYLLLQRRSLNALLIGEETAMTLGTDSDRFRKQLFLVTSLLTGVMVAVSGAIGFVGLMIPHSVRLLVGSDHRRVLPVSLLLGGIFLILADVLARMIIAPEELPIGIITALFGTPFFIWLMQLSPKILGGGR
ncbi:transport system permease protein (plasmid) [Trichormus variabilis ATCC 29413]|uniref:Transport system permease protein n=2 Tax=Anabaena variabilis TaxID=264691 RepID=Q3M2C2_TRIV2|nr:MULTISPECIES: iron ABC transporter permease [Nostocaceae]ABA24864.1 transport system permease protein [Trichormus variabilis ATCC 29413]MBC1218001.1 iron ABC transporter permease [Trichormus variabilis ARAD]MBC1259277.1 iron ABC transporter permease [Trichormus variabilis V5]MBC1270767.1 iron ABC transporter permease [Trichormus variabilis FSR]MBC1305702.1 iron ABC transporter permease [Trichormus variabilis N2B]